MEGKIRCQAAAPVRVSGFGIRVSGLGFRDKGLGIRD